jgi:hypothetical protein
MGKANAFLIEGQVGLTLIDAGFRHRKAAVFEAICGLRVSGTSGARHRLPDPEDVWEG